MGYETVLDALESDSRRVGYSSWNGEVQFRCPSHADTHASGSLREGEDGRALLYCHAGCDIEGIVDALGLEMKDLFAEEEVDEKEILAHYVYCGEDGAPLFRVVRFSPKGFTQERFEHGVYVPGLNGVRRVLYNLPAVLSESSTVYVVEGEKDVETLRQLGVTGTCNVGGAGKWRPEWSESLRGKDIIIIPDRDEPGEKHARLVQNSLDGVARSVTIKYARSGKDVSDHLAAGYALSQLADEPSSEETFGPLDWETYTVPSQEWLMEPYFPTRGRVLVYGKAGSLKSLWVMWVATRLAREGKRVAYFSLEMRPEQTVARLRKLKPPSTFKVFTNYQMGDADFLRRTIDALRGYDMIVIDSFNAAYRFSKGTHDDQVAELDDNFFQPIIEGTGATLVLIDNTGHDLIVGFGTKVASQHPRGTSAKIDKVDVAIWLVRPDEENNYLTEIHVKKMRYDLPIPTKRVVVAPSDHEGIEFYYLGADGEPGENMWEELDAIPEEEEATAEESLQLESISDSDGRESYKSEHGRLEHYVQSQRDMELDNDVANQADPNDFASFTTDEKLAFLRAERILGKLDSPELPSDNGGVEGT